MTKYSDLIELKTNQKRLSVLSSKLVKTTIKFHERLLAIMDETSILTRHSENLSKKYKVYNDNDNYHDTCDKLFEVLNNCSK